MHQINCLCMLVCCGRCLGCLKLNSPFIRPPPRPFQFPSPEESLFVVFYKTTRWILRQQQFDGKMPQLATPIHRFSFFRAATSTTTSPPLVGCFCVWWAVVVAKVRKGIERYSAWRNERFNIATDPIENWKRMPEMWSEPLLRGAFWIVGGWWIRNANAVDSILKIYFWRKVHLRSLSIRFLELIFVHCI